MLKYRTSNPIVTPKQILLPCIFTNYNVDNINKELCTMHKILNLIYFSLLQNNYYLSIHPRSLYIHPIHLSVPSIHPSLYWVGHSRLIRRIAFSSDSLIVQIHETVAVNFGYDLRIRVHTSDYQCKPRL
jgi:hypothetical protein